MIDWLIDPLTFEFMQRALLVAAVVGVACAVLSCWLTLLGWSLMGDAVSHAVLPGVVLSYVIGAPFAGVDKRSEATITTLLRDLAAEGRTLVVSTHDLVAVPALCDQVALINRRIIAHGDVDETLQPDLLADAFGGFVPQEALRACSTG